MNFVSVVFTPPSSSNNGSVWLLPVISLLVNNTVLLVRACLSIWLERFRGSQTEDKRWPLEVFNPLMAYSLVFFMCELLCQLMLQPFIIENLHLKTDHEFLERTK